MKFNVYRPVGTTRWIDEDQGRELTGYKTIEKVFQVEAADVASAIKKARSLKDPAPIVEPA